MFSQCPYIFFLINFEASNEKEAYISTQVPITHSSVRIMLLSSGSWLVLKYAGQFFFCLIGKMLANKQILNLKMVNIFLKYIMKII